MLIMQNNDSRLRKAARRTIRAEASLVLVIVVIISWSIYGLYKLSLGTTDSLLGVSITNNNNQQQHKQTQDNQKTPPPNNTITNESSSLPTVVITQSNNHNNNRLNMGERAAASSPSESAASKQLLSYSSIAGSSLGEAAGHKIKGAVDQSSSSSWPSRSQDQQHLLLSNSIQPAYSSAKIIVDYLNQQRRVLDQQQQLSDEQQRDLSRGFKLPVSSFETFTTRAGGGETGEPVAAGEGAGRLALDRSHLMMIPSYQPESSTAEAAINFPSLMQLSNRAAAMKREAEEEEQQKRKQQEPKASITSSATSTADNKDQGDDDNDSVGVGAEQQPESGATVSSSSGQVRKQNERLWNELDDEQLDDGELDVNKTRRRNKKKKKIRMTSNDEQPDERDEERLASPTTTRAAKIIYHEPDDEEKENHDQGEKVKNDDEQTSKRKNSMSKEVNNDASDDEQESLTNRNDEDGNNNNNNSSRKDKIDDDGSAAPSGARSKVNDEDEEADKSTNNSTQRDDERTSGAAESDDNNNNISANNNNEQPVATSHRSDADDDGDDHKDGDDDDDEKKSQEQQMPDADSLRETSESIDNEVDRMTQPSASSTRTSLRQEGEAEAAEETNKIKVPAAQAAFDYKNSVQFDDADSNHSPLLNHNPPHNHTVSGSSSSSSPSRERLPGPLTDNQELKQHQQQRQFARRSGGSIGNFRTHFLAPPNPMRLNDEQNRLNSVEQQEQHANDLQVDQNNSRMSQSVHASRSSTDEHKGLNNRRNLSRISPRLRKEIGTKTTPTDETLSDAQVNHENQRSDDEGIEKEQQQQDQNNTSQKKKRKSINLSSAGANEGARTRRSKRSLSVDAINNSSSNELDQLVADNNKFDIEMLDGNRSSSDFGSVRKEFSRSLPLVQLGETNESDHLNSSQSVYNNKNNANGFPIGEKIPLEARRRNSLEPEETINDVTDERLGRMSPEQLGQVGTNSGTELLAYVGNQVSPEHKDFDDDQKSNSVAVKLSPQANQAPHSNAAQPPIPVGGNSNQGDGEPKFHYLASNDTGLQELLSKQNFLSSLMQQDKLPAPASSAERRPIDMDLMLDDNDLNVDNDADGDEGRHGVRNHSSSSTNDHQTSPSLFTVDHGLLLYPEANEKHHHKEKSGFKKKKREEKYKKKKKSAVSIKKGGHKKKKHKKEMKKFLKEKKFKGAKKGKKVAKGKGGQGGKKGKKLYKDKGFKKKGFKNVYHKEEFGQKKSYFDEYRDKDFKKKWKKFDDKYNYAQMKKWQAKDIKAAKKKKDHGDNYKKYDKSKWKKKFEKHSKENMEKSSKKHKKSHEFR